jgi:hypothetical protein
MAPRIDINELHRNFWANRHADLKALLTNPRLVAIVARREAKKAGFVNWPQVKLTE